MVSDIKSSVVGAVILAIASFIFTLIINYMFSSGELQLFKVVEKDRKLAIITIDSWKVSENNSFRVFLYGTNLANIISSMSIYNLNYKYDGNGNTIISFDTDLYSDRQIVIIEVEDSFRESESKFISYPNNYSIVMGNRLSYRFITISSIVSALVCGISYLILSMLMEKRVNSIQEKLDERRNEIKNMRDELIVTQSQLDKSNRENRNSINSFKIIAMKRIVEYVNEIEMWRSAMIKLMNDSGSSNENARKIISSLVKSHGGGGGNIMDVFKELNYSEILDIVEEMRVKKGAQ